MGNAGYPAALLEMREVEAAARTSGLEIDTAELRRAEARSLCWSVLSSSLAWRLLASCNCARRVRPSLTSPQNDWSALTRLNE
jgi:hypothetical protein